jgi:hypothetical protein
MDYFRCTAKQYMLVFLLLKIFLFIYLVMSAGPNTTNFRSIWSPCMRNRILHKFYVYRLKFYVPRLLRFLWKISAVSIPLCANLPTN